MTANTKQADSRSGSPGSSYDAVNEASPRHSDCYSETERISMERYQRIKQRLLLPLLGGLDRFGVTPNGVTVASMVMGLVFCPLYLLGDFTSNAGFSWVVIAWVALMGHVIVDGIDGPLARFQQKAGPRGSFTDTMADQVVLAATTLTFIAAEPLGLPGLGLFAGGFYIFLYTVAVAFAMVRNSLGIPYGFLLRPRYWVLVCLFIECFLWPTPTMAFITEILIWAFNGLLAWSVWDGFLAIRRKL